MDNNEIVDDNSIWEEIDDNITLRESGKFIGIPYFKIYARFGIDFSTLEKGHQGMLTANSGIGKTHWWIEMLLMQVWIFKEKLRKEGKEPGFIPIYKIALLENTKKEFQYRLISRILAYITNKVYPAQLLKGRGTTPMARQVLEDNKDELHRIYTEIMSMCTIVDNIVNPTGLYKWARKESELHGTHLYRTETYDGKETTVYNGYKQHNELEHIIMIMDNANNLVEEKGADTQHLAIRRWYRDYGRLQITKHWQWTLINIHQQASDGEKQEFSFGKSIVSKLKPSTSGLGNNKEVQRDCHFIWGLFNPSKYEIPEYQGYDITKLRNFFRSLLILKQNDSTADVEYPFYFHGGASIMSELPKPNELDYSKYV